VTITLRLHVFGFDVATIKVAIDEGYPKPAGLTVGAPDVPKLAAKIKKRVSRSWMKDVLL
jgi:hypothetical protein